MSTGANRKRIKHERIRNEGDENNKKGLGGQNDNKE